MRINDVLVSRRLAPTGGQYRRRFGRTPSPSALAALALLVLLLGGVPTPAGASPDPRGGTGGHVDEHLQREAARQPGALLRVLIHRQSKTATIDSVLAHGGRITGILETANAVAAEIPASQLASLAAQPGVVRISSDAPVKLQGSPGLSNLGPGSLATAYPLAVGATDGWTAAPAVQGTGVTVAVLDSGIHELPDFLDADPSTCGPGAQGCAGRVLKRVAVVPDAAGGPDDDNGHGTWVAGIIGGRQWQRNRSGGYVGIAPDVNLIGIKVSDRDGMARTSDVIRGIEWAVKNKDLYGIRVLNLSLVSSVAESYQTSLLDAAVELAWLKGLVVVAAAGNGGPDTMRYPPANDPYVITVGATDDQGSAGTDDDQLARFSSYGLTQDGVAKPELVAPGRHIVSTLASPSVPLAQLYPNKIVDRTYISLSGTSASAPVVSGVVAQLLQAHPRLTPDQMKWLLRQTARPVPGAGTGAGYAQAGRAVRFAGAVDRDNRGLVPNTYLARAGYVALYGNPATAWDSVSWDTVSWDTVSWDSVSWDTVSWDSVSWDTVSWDTVSWDTVAGD